ncbi:hypothetical protein PR048_018086 [Dryococelus australis]|uniref:Uncharacterized protein n=1 Tax=Dryococelus australis TaxID=614101 RepID=A0ABQ9HBF1_9NEOP|nr:hypothetical protein PR048_018086 [Dryococelus australis]
MVESVGKYLLEFPKTHTELMNAATCKSDSDIEACMTSSCTNCPKNYLEKFESHENLDKTVSWKDWTYVGNSAKVVMNTVPCKAAIKQLKVNIEKLVQAEYFEEITHSSSKMKFRVLIEIMIVTLLTCCIWLPTLETKPIVINDTSHTNDNCAAQFKNRYVLAILADIKDYAELDILLWAFFAASHGKGSVDGLSRTVKKVILNCAEDFLYVKNEVKGIHIIYVSKTDIEDEELFLNSIWTYILPIPKIQSL